MALSGDAQRRVAGQADAGNQHHHPPYLIRVECTVGTVILVWQQRQDHQRQYRELQEGNQVAACQAARDAVQFGLEVKQHGGHDGEHHRELVIAVPHHRPQPVTQDDGRHRGGAGVIPQIRRARIGRHHHAAHHQQATRQHPGSVGLLRQ